MRLMLECLIIAIVSTVAVVEPRLLIVLLGVLLLLLCLRAGRRSLLVLVFAALFAPSVESALGVPALGAVDESVVMLVFVAAAVDMTRRREVPRPGIWIVWFGAYVLMAVVSAVEYRVAPMIAAQSLLLTVKMPVLALSLAAFKWTSDDVRFLATLLTRMLVGILAATTFINVVSGEAWARWLSSDGTAYIDYRFGLLAVQGPFEHPLIYGNVAAMAAIASLARTQISAERTGKIGTAVGAVAVLLSARRTALVGAILGFIVALPRKVRVPGLVALSTAGALALLVFWADIRGVISATYNEYVLQTTGGTRTRLLLDSVALANEYFPFGAGVGRFGSYVAAAEYSPEYIRLGYPSIWGLQDSSGYGAFLTDTHWPGVLGESGWIGLVCYILFLISLATKVRKLNKSDSAMDAWLTRSTFGCLGVALVASVGLPSLSSTPIALLLYLIIGVALARCAHIATYRTDGTSMTPASGHLSKAGVL